MEFYEEANGSSSHLLNDELLFEILAFLAGHRVASELSVVSRQFQQVVAASDHFWTHVYGWGSKGVNGMPKQSKHPTLLRELSRRREAAAAAQRRTSRCYEFVASPTAEGRAMKRGV